MFRMAKAKKSVNVVVSKSSSRVTGLDVYAVAYAIAIIAAVKVLILSVATRMGWSSAGEILSKVLMSWNTGVSGILTGMAEAAVCGLIVGFCGAWLYNKFA